MVLSSQAPWMPLASRGDSVSSRLNVRYEVGEDDAECEDNGEAFGWEEEAAAALPSKDIGMRWWWWWWW